jgi:hypothetical protein
LAFGDGGIEPLNERSTPTRPGVARALGAEREPHAASLDDHVLAPLCGIEDGRETLPDLRARIALHMYIVQLREIILAASWSSGPTRRFRRTR